MKLIVRRWIRQSDFASKTLHWLITKLPLSNGNKKKLCLLYLQCSGYRQVLSDVLAISIDLVGGSDKQNSCELNKSAVIKAPKLTPSGELLEKGVLMVGFEHELSSLAEFMHLDRACDLYDILFLPTWQPFYSVELLNFLSRRPDSLVMLPSSQQCYFQVLQNSVIKRALPFHASSWVDGELYDPAEERDIDILMVANFSIYKRHYLLFEALQTLPSDLNVVLIGRELGDRTAAVLMAEARSYGVENRFMLIESPENQVVVNHLCRAKIVLGLSGREGSYVSLAEALFAGAAVGIYADAVVGTKNYINPQTGFLLQPGLPLAAQIKRCLQLQPTLAPREWAVSNIDTRVNVSKLNQLLKAESQSLGRPWSNECEPFRIQNFVFEPMSGCWSQDIVSAVDDLAEMGLHLKSQIK